MLNDGKHVIPTSSDTMIMITKQSGQCSPPSPFQEQGQRRQKQDRFLLTLSWSTRELQQLTFTVREGLNIQPGQPAHSKALPSTIYVCCEWVHKILTTYDSIIINDLQHSNECANCIHCVDVVARCALLRHAFTAQITTTCSQSKQVTWSSCMVCITQTYLYSSNYLCMHAIKTM